jgi:Family of unknown function (DUF6491)
MMQRLVPFVLLPLLAACASNSTVDKQAVTDFISARNLEQVPYISSDTSDGWKKLNDYYLLYHTRRGEFLVEFGSRCWDLSTNRVAPDTRWDSTRIEARFDTIRGCRIANIYALTDAEAEELRNLGEAPGSRN